MNFLRAHEMFLVDVIDFCIIDVRLSSAVRFNLHFYQLQ